MSLECLPVCCALCEEKIESVTENCSRRLELYSSFHTRFEISWCEALQSVKTTPSWPPSSSTDKWLESRTFLSDALLHEMKRILIFEVETAYHDTMRAARNMKRAVSDAAYETEYSLARATQENLNMLRRQVDYIDRLIEEMIIVHA